MPKALRRRIRLMVERENMTWDLKLGRFAFSHLVRGYVQLSFRGDHGEVYFEVWRPLGWGLYWRAARAVLCIDKD
jgi:hypothetical protein